MRTHTGTSLLADRRSSSVSLISNPVCVFSNATPPPAGKHWPCLQSLSQTSGHSPADVSKGQSEDEAETVSAMASLSVDVEQQASLVHGTEAGR